MSANLQFALSYAVSAGHYIKAQRNNLINTKELDRTDVTNVDLEVNADFEQKVAVLSEGRASVTGEESSYKVADSEEEWIIDPVDGTGEYIDDTLLDRRELKTFATSQQVSASVCLSVLSRGCSSLGTRSVFVSGERAERSFASRSQCIPPGWSG